MKALLLGGLLAAAVTCVATDVGIFDNTRLYHETYNMQTGASVETLRGIWETAGAVWHETPALTASFLATVDVFYTSKVNSVTLTTIEQEALADWLRAGGTLVVTGECG